MVLAVKTAKDLANYYLYLEDPLDLKLRLFIINNVFYPNWWNIRTNVQEQLHMVVETKEGFIRRHFGKLFK